MPHNVGGPPLDRYAFSSADPEEITDFITQMYVGSRSRFGPVKGQARFAVTAVGDELLRSDEVRSSIDFHGTTDGFDYFQSFLVVQGTVRLSGTAGEATFRPGDTGVYPFASPQRFEMRGMGVRAVRLPLDRLADAVASVGGATVGPVQFTGLEPVSPAANRYWRSIVSLVTGSLFDPDSPMSSALLREELSWMAALAAVHTFPNPTMTQQHRPNPGHVEPAAVRRAAAFVEEHAHLPVTIAQIAEAAGTTPRAIQYAFRRHHDTTPTEYLRRVRLERAHRELQAADPLRGDTVAAIAARWGFAKPSRFAATYRAVYGRLPSQTLRG